MGPEPERLPEFSGACGFYCHRVAGVVGRLAALHFRLPPTAKSWREYAEKLGLAFQLTQHIRDVGEDARKSRIYFP